MTNKTLILSIALNGYQWMYKKELTSHKKYATKHGYNYQAVTRPYVTELGVECCWLKLTLMQDALLSGYDNVLFLDADTLVSANCPALSTIFEEGKYIYMAKGYSGRFNSGVILAKNNRKTLNWLRQVIASQGQPVRIENDVGWGENGHVIEFSKDVPFISELDKKWNNTFDYALNDYIRHSNCGPMRTSFIVKAFHRLVFFISARIITRLTKKSIPSQVKRTNELLISETKKIISLYPTLTNS